MTRRVWLVCTALLCVGAIEFAVLAGAFDRIGRLGDAQPAYAGVVASPTPTPTGTSTPVATPTPTLGTITGFVRDQANQPIAGAWVYAEPTLCCAGGGGDYSGADGSYTIHSLEADSYRLHAEMLGYVGEYYDNVGDYNTATLVVVTGPNPVAGIDFSLALGAHIKGVVKDAGNQPIQGAQIHAQTSTCCADGWSDYGYTDANGAYDVQSLSAGSFIVFAQASGFAPEYYDNVYVEADATAVVVAPQATASNINFNLDHGGAISGTVRDEANHVIANANVEIRHQPDGAVLGGASSGADGTYTVTDLPGGDYKVDAFKWFGEYMPEYYNNVETPAAATLVHVTKDLTTSNIDFSLRPPNPDKWRETLEFFTVPYVRTVNTTGFGTESGETQPCGAIGATAWFKHWVQSYPMLLPLGTPPGQVSFPSNPVMMQADTAGSSFDTVIAVYDDANPSPPAAPVGNPLLLNCNDDAPGGSESVMGGAIAAGRSKVTWNAIPGHVYIIQAGGKNGATGSLVLNVGCPGDGDCDAVANTGDNCPAVWNYDQINTDNTPLTTPGVIPLDTTLANGDALGDACDPDDDNDGLTDEQETGYGVVSPPGGCITAISDLDPHKADSDGDGVLDGAECALGSNPNNPSSKPAPGVPDNDGDGLSNAFETSIGSNPNNKDSDGDGVLDGIEYKGYNTSLTNVNTDGDGCSDGREIASVDANSAVNSLDLQIVAKNFLLANKPALDVNKDGLINSLDLQLVAKNFAPGSC